MTGLDGLRWERAWGSFAAYAPGGELIGRVVPVEEGWAASTALTYLGIYLTGEMARGAVVGMRRIEVHGGYYAPPAQPARLAAPPPVRARLRQASGR